MSDREYFEASILGAMVEAGEPVTAAAICDIIGADGEVAAEVSRSLYRLRRDGRIVLVDKVRDGRNTPRNLYSLPPTQPAQDVAPGPESAEIAAESAPAEVPTPKLDPTEAPPGYVAFAVPVASCAGGDAADCVFCAHERCSTLSSVSCGAQARADRTEVRFALAEPASSETPATTPCLGDCAEAPVTPEEEAELAALLSDQGRDETEEDLSDLVDLCDEAMIALADALLGDRPEWQALRRAQDAAFAALCAYRGRQVAK